MFEFAASEFESLMHAHQTFRRVDTDQIVSGGSLVLGVDELRYTDGRTTVVFIGSSASMQLRITRRPKKKSPEEVLVDGQFTDFGLIRETIKEHIS